MLEQIGDVLGNAHFEAYWGGPLMGVIFAAIYERLKSPPNDQNNRANPPEVLRQIKEERRIVIKQTTTVVVSSGNSSDDGVGALIAMAIVGACLMFLGVAYLHQISYALYTVSTAAASFSFTASLMAYLGGRFNNKGWWLHTLIPAVASLACIYITVCAERAISPDVVAYAQGLLGNQKINIGVIIGCAIKFMQNLHSEYVQYIMFDLLAFILVAGAALMAFIQTIHYIALTNASGSERSVWGWLAVSTARFSTFGATVFLIAILAFAYLGATGTLFDFLHSQRQGVQAN